MTSKRKNLIGFTAATIALVVAVVFMIIFRLQIDSGNELAFREGTCGFSQVYHLYCPSCGGTRAVTALVNFDILGSLIANPLPIYAACLLLRIWGALLHNVLAFRSKEGSAKTKLWPVLCTWEMWGILVVIVGWFILRNILLAVFKIDLLGDMQSYWM